MTDPTCDYHLIEKACDVIYDKRDFFIDPSSGRFSASRWGLKRITQWGIAASWVLILGGFLLNMPQAFTVSGVILTGICASNAGVYFSSTRKQYACNKEDGE